MIFIMFSLFNDMRCERYVAFKGREEECIQGFGGKARRKESTRRPRCRWEDNINMDLRDIGVGGMDCIDLTQDRYQLF
jgi:hypothetical protein